VIVGVGVAYLATCVLATPEYFSFVVPLVLEYYAGHDAGSVSATIIGEQASSILLALGPLGLAAIALPRAHLARCVALFTLAAAISGILQAKGWDYHFFAARAGTIMLAGVVVAALIDRYGASARTGGRLPMLGLAATLMATLFFLSGVLSPPFKGQRNFAVSPAGRLLPLFEAEAPGQPVLWMTTSIYPQFPLLNYTRGTLAMHFQSLWLLPALYAKAPVVGDRLVYHSPQEMSAPERLVYTTVADDLTRFKPALVVVTRAADERGFNGRQFDYLEYFGRNPVFAEAFKDYRPLTQIDGWTIYKRK
jgi:hypothetical protein